MESQAEEALMRGLAPERKTQLRSIPLFKSCSDKELGQIDALVDDIEVDVGEVLIREGAPGRESFVIITGEASITIRNEEVARLGPGEFLGEMALLASTTRRTATVTALSPMHLLVVEPRGFRSLLEIGCVAAVMLKGVVERLSALQSDTV